MLKKTLCGLVASALLLSVMPSDAALNAYLRMKGQKTGDIKGSVAQKGRENTIMVIAYEHEVKSPTDAASGLATGKAQHGVFKITKEVDKSSPLLYNLLVNNENITEFKLDFWRPTNTGVDVQMYTVKLTNARITNIKGSMPNSKSNPSLVGYPETEEVSFAYQKIEWTWNDGGIMASGSWQGGP